MSVLCKKKDFINQYKHLSGVETHPRWIDFVNSFFESTSSSSLEDLSADTQLTQQIRMSWRDFFAQGDAEKLVRITYDYQELTGRLILNIVQPDQPFLVETLKTHLNAYHVKADQIFHPIFAVKRDLKTSEILDFSSTREKIKPGYHFESVISADIGWNLAPSIIAKFVDELSWRFHMLQLSIRDWPKMRQVIQHVVPRNYHQEWEYFNWLFEDNFIFVGFREISVSKKGKNITTATVQGSRLGLFKDDFFEKHQSFGVQDLSVKRSLIFSLRKTSVRSPINRSARLDLIEVEDKKGGRVFQIIGIFARRSYNASIFHIPILKKKAQRIFDSFGLQRNWHDGKVLLQALESIPHDEYWYLSDEALESLCSKAIAFHEKSLPAFVSHFSESEKSQTIVIFLGRERYSIQLKDALGKALATEFYGTISSTRGIVDDAPFARVIYVIDNISRKFSESAAAKIITEHSLTWDEKRIALSHLQTVKDPFFGVFNEDYQHDFSPEQSVLDGEIVQSIGIKSNYGMRVECSKTVLEETFSSNVSLRIFTLNKPLNLTHLLDVFQNFGVSVSQEKTYALKNGLYYLHNCVGHVPPHVISETFSKSLSEIVEKTLEENYPNDGFNRLFTLCNFSERQVQVFRALFAYTQQLRYNYDPYFFVSSLVEHGEATTILLQWFETKFDVNLSNTRRHKEIEEKKKAFGAYMERVTNASQDHLFQDLSELIDVMVRTNYYLLKDSLSFKFMCSEMSKLLDPRPMFETFVYSLRMEGVHLRTSKVARGGIRYSDRPQDYRSEILQLMQAQNLKNSIIVPTGAKGGFIVRTKNPTKEDVVLAYKTFIASLLDLVDNLEDGQLVHPRRVVVYDGEDPYFVVAADKGTATFSDIANGLSSDYGFWLGDAFASGGSHGYDHKKLGITAKGAFVSVEHHFNSLGIDISKENITVVGVGDMSGDVFGNGMLCQRTLHLLAAFNHKHIFIDPAPDAERSYLERKRLFDVQGGWDDYNTGLISEGGGLFNRSDKVLYVSEAIQNLFKVPEKVTPDALIRGILGAKVDLLWFGGIGTYIRGNEEFYQGDGANDAVRMTSDSIQVRVIGEGANLGVTPTARIELGLKGVVVNSDAIDNAGGVNCSDHEVNLKILVGTESSGKRDALLEELEKEVAEHVLAGNKKQNIALDIMASDGREHHGKYVDLITLFERQGSLKRKTVFLEKDDVLRHQRSYLTRSENAVVLSFAKNAVSRLILEHFDALREYALPFVKAYFPKNFENSQSLEAHMLYEEIAALMMTDAAVNFMGPLWFFEQEDQTLPRVELFVKLFDAWGMEKILADIMSGSSGEVVEKLRVLREALTFASAFFKEGAEKNFGKICVYYKKMFKSDPGFSEYPYLLALARRELGEREIQRFFELRESLKFHDLYAAIFHLPEVESWQLPQKHKLLNELFEKHLLITKLDDTKISSFLPMNSLQGHMHDYGFASYMLESIKELR